MGIYEIRRGKIRELVKEMGTQAALAAKIGRQPNYVNRLVKGKINLGESLAREIEPLVGKPPLWLDGVPAGLVEAALPVFKKIIELSKQPLPQLSAEELQELADDELFTWVVNVVDRLVGAAASTSKARAYRELFRECKHRNVTDEAGVLELANLPYSEFMSGAPVPRTKRRRPKAGSGRARK